MVRKRSGNPLWERGTPGHLLLDKKSSAEGAKASLEAPHYCSAGVVRIIDKIVEGFRLYISRGRNRSVV